jgi:hypothetical protein
MISKPVSMTRKNPITIARKIATGIQLLKRSNPTNKLVLGRFSIN